MITKFEERIHPDLREVFLGLEPISFGRDLVKERQYSKALFIDPDGISVTTQSVPSFNNSEIVTVQVFRPTYQTQTLPGLLWIHGGGFALGHPEQDSSLCQRFVRDVHCVVVSVDYRLAPEHPFPSALEDCYAALLWMSQPNSPLDIDTTRIAVAGASAGGGLTVSVTLMARDLGGPNVLFQMPLCPMLESRNDRPSNREITDERVWNRETNGKAWKMYLSGRRHSLSKYAVPGNVRDISGLPPAYISIGELDVLRDETTAFVTRLLQAGVATEYHMYPGCFHGFENTVPGAPVTKKAVSEYCEALRTALHT